MKCKKMISALCATAMLFSLASFANAAEVDDPVSEFAGQTVACQVVDQVDGKITTRTIMVDIPEGTTMSEENALLLGAAYGPQTRSARGNVDILSTRRDFTITNSGTKAGSATAKQDYARIHVSFHISGEPTATRLQVYCLNETTNRGSEWKQVDINTSPLGMVVIFSTSDVKVNEGDKFYVNASTMTGSAFCTTCTVQGATF